MIQILNICIINRYRLYIHTHIYMCVYIYIYREREREREVSQVALVVKNLPGNAGDIEMWVQSLGWEDPLEEGMATHSSILA